MKRVLITGGAGFIGRHCLPELLARGYEVHATSRNPPTHCAGDINWHQIDLLDDDRIEGLTARVRPSHLLHLAWDTTPRQYWTSPDNLRWVQASLDLVQSFVRNGGRRIVFAGTCAEYDWTHGYCREDVTPLTPSTLYGSCKHALHLMADAYLAQHDVTSAWGRLFFLYGPYEQPERFVPSVIRALLRGESARCTHGRQLRDFLHIAEAASALATVLDSGLTGPINVASGEAVALKDIAGIIADQLGKRNLLKLGSILAPPNDPPELLANVSRLADELSWSPRRTLAEGLGKTIAWWRSHERYEAVHENQ